MYIYIHICMCACVIFVFLRMCTLYLIDEIYVLVFNPYRSKYSILIELVFYPYGN